MTAPANFAPWQRALICERRPDMTMLYRSTDCLCRCGAPMKNLAHSASFESLEKNAPSNPGTKHLAALRASDRAGKVVTVGYELMDDTRAALLDGILTLVISHPLERLSDEVMSGMIKALNMHPRARTFTSVLPFDIYTRENI